MPVFRKRISQTTLNWVLTLLAFAALLPALFIPFAAQAEFRAFRLKITDVAGGTERQVVTRFDHLQYPMYRFIKKTEFAVIDQTWMCYDRSDHLGAVCAAPPKSPALDSSGGPGLAKRAASGNPQDRRPAIATPPKR